MAKSVNSKQSRCNRQIFTATVAPRGRPEVHITSTKKVECPAKQYRLEREHFRVEYCAEAPSSVGVSVVPVAAYTMHDPNWPISFAVANALELGPTSEARAARRGLSFLQASADEYAHYLTLSRRPFPR